MNTMMNRTYSQMLRYHTFEDRFKYLKLYGTVAGETFGADRYLNQAFYQSEEWRTTRDQIIVRDSGCDLGIIGRELNSGVVVHHINPITAEDILNRDPKLLDPENLITIWDTTHKALHYGDERVLKLIFKERRPGDTCPWK